MLRAHVRAVQRIEPNVLVVESLTVQSETSHSSADWCHRGFSTTRKIEPDCEVALRTGARTSLSKVVVHHERRTGIERHVPTSPTPPLLELWLVAGSAVTDNAESHGVTAIGSCRFWSCSTVSPRRMHRRRSHDGGATPERHRRSGSSSSRSTNVRPTHRYSTRAAAVADVVVILEA